MSLKARDSQKTKVYRWEECFGTKSASLSQSECIDLMARARARYGLQPVPIVFDSRNLRCSTAYGDRKIRLATWGLNVITVLHETAHTIINSNFKTFYLTDDELARETRKNGYAYKSMGYWRIASHGPEFCAVLVDLFQTFGVVQQAQALEKARQYRIKVAPLQQIRRKLMPTPPAPYAVAASPVTPPTPPTPPVTPKPTSVDPPFIGTIQLGLF